jgi:2-C-methyl-D-erythritol 2,4-cyclodiphosphate synthase/2-C-methyl-D-erythritol 4-phosphate cytidylyltransferase
MHNTQFDLVLLAAGKGERLGGRDKATIKLGGDFAICHQLDIFSETKGLNKIIITYRPSNLKRLKEVMRYHPLFDRCIFVKGGNERVDSVFNALKILKDSSSRIVAIHDVARPNINKWLIYKGIEISSRFGTAIPAVPLVDTIKEVIDDRVVRTIPRENIYQIQTPQFFDRELILYAYSKWYKDKGGFIPTDDSSLIERLGISPVIFKGDRANIKITYEEDLKMFEHIKRYRTGFGYDIHRLKKGGNLYIGGVVVDRSKSAIAHSDGDVLIHAICDALLGACGMRDIGHHFPNSDKKYKNISSLILLKETIEIIRKEGFGVENIDTTIILESPKIGKYIDGMKENISRVLNISPDEIGIKATTPEKTGIMGKGKAIAAYCTALISK